MFTIRHVVLGNNMHAHFFAAKTCELGFCRTLEIVVTNDRKYQTCLIFVVHDTSDKNPVYFPRTLGFS